MLRHLGRRLALKKGERQLPSFALSSSKCIQVHGKQLGVMRPLGYGVGGSWWSDCILWSLSHQFPMKYWSLRKRAALLRYVVLRTHLQLRGKSASLTEKCIIPTKEWKETEGCNLKWLLSSKSLTITDRGRPRRPLAHHRLMWRLLWWRTAMVTCIQKSASTTNSSVSWRKILAFTWRISRHQKRPWRWQCTCRQSGGKKCFPRGSIAFNDARERADDHGKIPKLMTHQL